MNSAIIKAGVGGAGAIGIVLALLFGSWGSSGKEARHDLMLANDFRIVFANEPAIKRIDPGAFVDHTDSLMIHRGWFYPQKRFIVVYMVHPEHVTPEFMVAIPGLLVKACRGAYTPADAAAFPSDVRDIVGVIFHEAIGHGSDDFIPQHLFSTLQMYWPDQIVPNPEPVQNPWDIVRRYWPMDATHPELETKH